MGQLHAVMVTYRRSETARSTLQTVLSTQTRPPDGLTVVVDNGSSGEVASWAAELGVRYVDAGDNLGPAGGWALGLREVLQQASDDDFVLILDDDDPPPFATAIADLLSILTEMRRTDPTIAVTGLTGARFDRRWGIVRRILDEDLDGWTDVDFIASGQLPIYAISALREVGVFDDRLFFGWEDLEYGLRLRRYCRRLVISAPITMRVRQMHDRTGLGARASGPGLPPWRRYYSTRNLIAVSREHAGPLAPWSALIHSGLISSIRTLVIRRRPHESLMALRGALDGALGRTGRRVTPPDANANSRRHD